MTTGNVAPKIKSFYYVCRCPTYPALSPGCTMVTDVNDQCCQTPQCAPISPSPNVTTIPGVPGATITGSTQPNTNNPITGKRGVCMGRYIHITSINIQQKFLSIQFILFLTTLQKQHKILRTMNSIDKDNRRFSDKIYMTIMTSSAVLVFQCLSFFDHQINKVESHSHTTSVH